MLCITFSRFFDGRASSSMSWPAATLARRRHCDSLAIISNPNQTDAASVDKPSSLKSTLICERVSVNLISALMSHPRRRRRRRQGFVSEKRSRRSLENKNRFSASPKSINNSEMRGWLLFTWCRKMSTLKNEGKRMILLMNWMN